MHFITRQTKGHKIHLLVYYCSSQGLHRCECGVEELMRELVRTLKTETAQPRMFALVAIECSFSCPIHSLTPNAPSSITVVHAVTSMCEVALLVQHVTHPVTQCEITWMECQCSWLSLNLGIDPGLEYRDCY